MFFMLFVGRPMFTHNFLKKKKKIKEEGKNPRRFIKPRQRTCTYEDKTE